MHFIKKNIIIPLVVFIIGMSAVAGIVCSINNEQNKQNRTMANLNAMTYAAYEDGYYERHSRFGLIKTDNYK